MESSTDLNTEQSWQELDRLMSLKQLTILVSGILMQVLLHVSGSNKISAGKFFIILREVNQKYNFKTDRVCNADQSWLSAVPTKLPKFVTQ